MPKARHPGDRALPTIEFSSRRGSGVPRERRAPVLQHERLTPLSHRFSWQLRCERNDPIRTMLPCQHLAIRDAARKSWSAPLAAAKRPRATGYFAVQVKVNLL